MRDERKADMFIGFFLLLFLVLLVLKLTAVIAWSWWLVCAPIAIVVVVPIAVLFIAIVTWED